MQNQKKQRTELLNAKQIEEFSKLTSMASKIRYLSAITTSKGDIARYLDIRYQWVRNVLNTPLKK